MKWFIIVFLISVSTAFPQSTDTLILKDAVDEAGIRAQMATQGYSSQYIDYYLSKRRKSVYVVGQTPSQAAEAQIELEKVLSEIAALDKEQAQKQKAKQDAQIQRMAALEELVKQQAEALKKAEEKIAELEAAQKKSGP